MGWSALGKSHVLRPSQDGKAAKSICPAIVQGACRPTARIPRLVVSSAMMALVPELPKNLGALWHALNSTLIPR
jgi:hypothetical protein